jgi:hypothetical protein
VTAAVRHPAPDTRPLDLTVSSVRPTGGGGGGLGGLIDSIVALLNQILGQLGG